jgi:predicted enzyme related to lactoylglutathione lyase
MLKPEGFYIWVDNLDEAITFYEKVFEQKIAHREKDRWADFGDDRPIKVGIYNYTVDKDDVKKGNNITPELRTKDILLEHERIKKFNPTHITEIIVLEQPVLYKYFQFEDKWGNIWEVSEHYYD